MIQDFTATLKVDKKIVPLLSKSTYQKSFSSAIRELISNAYDADALSFKINISKDFEIIEMEDDGNGMTPDEFYKYLTIAGTKSHNFIDLTRRYKRKRIGQFGVGFLATFPFCETLEITTTTENSNIILTALIPASEYFKAANDINVDEIPIKGKIYTNEQEKNKKYTKVKFIKPSFLVKQYFTNKETRKRESISTWDPIKRFKWELQEDLPIPYNPHFIHYKSFIYPEPIGINVFFNEERLYRNNMPSQILEQDTVKINGIECNYVFATDYKAINPVEARGVKMRVNNVGIGERTDFDLKRNRGYSRLHWISGEVWLSEKIKPYLNLARDGFIMSPLIVEINDYLAEKLSKLAYYVEDIAVAEKEIDKTINDNRKASVKSKKEIISENLNKLEKRGFTLVKAAKNDKIITQAYTVDKANKIISVAEDIPIENDIAFILGEKIQLYYTNAGSTGYPCKFIRKDAIEINMDYPLFKSRTYGNVFKKMHLLLLIAVKRNSNSSKMYDEMINNFIEEFNEFKK